MRLELISILRCPATRQALELQEADRVDDEICSGWLVTANGMHRYPIINYVPRFVGGANYAGTFGLQWNKFRRTQLDSHSGYPISANRFWTATAWRPDQIAEQWILDIGCGAGRFAEVALRAGAHVVALDYSGAVDACYQNLKGFTRCHVVQGDVYDLPFAAKSFSFVYSLGVLQHTPKVERAFASLPPMLAQGGRLCVDFYERSWKSRLLPKYFLRPLTKRLPPQKLLAALEHIVPKLYPLSRLMGRLPMGHVFKRVLPVADPVFFYERAYGRIAMEPEERLTWSLLDTFDWLSPQFDNPQTAEIVQQWMDRAGLEEIEVLKAGHLVGRGKMQ